MENITAHIISHSHWDREWYMPFEKHRVKLVQLMDDLMELFETNPEFKSFHLDGQTIILDDYLEVRPQMREKVMKYVKEGKLIIGPWYILQDEFLTSSESNVRNLLIGMRDAKRYGSVALIGYFPDAFGNIGQAPQILKQAGMKAVAFGRGVRSVGFDNQIMDKGNYESSYSEMLWESPDGTKLLGILFANWYNNGNEIPVDENEAKGYWDNRLNSAGRLASTRHYLYMNGCDHQPVQKNLPQALKTAQKLYPEVNFVHSNFIEYVDQVLKEIPDNLSVIHGELRSQETDGRHTLVNTASSRLYLKQMNQACQTGLEKVAEPLAVFAAKLGKEYPHDLLTHAWKTLMKNHPHDSICGCSVDEVHREMVTRFNKCRAITEEIVNMSLDYITSHINTKEIIGSNDESIPFVVYNTTGWSRRGVVEAELELGRKHGNLTGAYEELETLDIDPYDWILTDSEGREIDFSMEDVGVRFGYDLPDDKFRQPYMARYIKLTFESKEIPALGYSTYVLKKGVNGSKPSDSLITAERQMENDNIKVFINQDGTLDITNKKNGHVFHGLCYYEDVGDIGNEYIFVQSKDNKAIITKNVPAEINVIEDKPYRATFEITHNIEIPESADDILELEMKKKINIYDRKAKRSEVKTILRIITKVSLEKSGKGVKINTSFNNNAKNHRLRVLIPSNLHTDVHYADSVFEAAVRKNKPSAKWSNPSNCQHQQAYVSINDSKNGLTVANIGLNEYEILRDGANTIAVTLLRAVGEMGDWGVFPAPEAQCLGEHYVDFEIIPHEGSLIESGAFIEAYQFQVPFVYCQAREQEGSLPYEGSFIKWQGPSLALSGIKMSEETGNMVLRWFNLSRDKCKLIVALTSGNDKLFMSNVVEEVLSEIPTNETGSWELDVRGAEIVTLVIEKN